ncbi:SMI1/KNR4 family protein [Streptomyces sp. NPDC056656]|uniref:SMI1/KNR4 family protein n=1 Tax=Streptomyces sp. NPDC056656 TaxID=3345895 RepID=UPI0036BD3062
MTETAALAALRQLMPPTADSDVSVDWGRVSQSWGKQFPPDYRQFMEVYGAGAIDNFLQILKPEAKGDEPESETGGMLHETANAEHAWSTVRRSPELAGAQPELIAWGAAASADVLCWDASGDDPAGWPVLVYNRGDGLWRRYDCGMAEFLARVLRADFDACPLGDLSLWGRTPATFLTWTEEQRLMKQGLDPWTGEPDPYAGMFDD